MRFYADLHIHSKYSRATSKNLDLENLAYWGRKKGITVIGTGDFTHPAWIKEIKEKLVPAEPGLYRLRDDLEKKVTEQLPPICHGKTRFMLSVEISTIYKKGEKVRKIHHLVYAPTIEQAEKINARLEKIGNIRSDGRPILGLDSRNLLEIVLEAGRDCYIVPAHIWTPWFAVLGSKSGFDSISECYADLSDHIFAAETGLSSDPEMNWTISDLDKYCLVSNSDAHSPGKLGREANLFETDLDYFAMKRALETRSGFGGTVEFFPEEGKYHLDGHRKCNIRLTPEESKAHQHLCPACGKPLTLGVSYRVSELADRQWGEKPEVAQSFKSFVPLPEMISEIAGVGPSSKKVAQEYEQILFKLGAELEILGTVPIEQIEKKSSSLVAEAVRRMRQGEVIREAGYDGEYGNIKLFQPEEIKNKKSAGVLFDVDPKSVKENKKVLRKRKGTEKKRPASQTTPRNIPKQSGLDEDQAKALSITKGPLLIVAGPGSGKTRTLTHRIAHLIQTKTAKPEECLTITFTKRAAGEMKRRLQDLIPGACQNVPVMTFHALGLEILREHRTEIGLPRGFRLVTEEERCLWLMDQLNLSPKKSKKLLRSVSILKRMSETTDIKDVLEAKSLLDGQREKDGWIDFDDLLLLPVKLFEEHAGLASYYARRFPWVSIDEYQDIDDLQYRLIKHLVPPSGNLCAIGDPDQAIYSFRGSDVKFFLDFEKDFPETQKIHLMRNYRSGQSILAASSQMILPSSLVENREMEALLEEPGKIVIHHATTDRAEAEFVVHEIEKMLGGISFFSIDSARSEGDEDYAYSFSDFAVLYRTESQTELLEEALGRSGIPFQRWGHRSLSENAAVRHILETTEKSAKEKITEKLSDAYLELEKEDLPSGDSACFTLLGEIATRCDRDWDFFLSQVHLTQDIDAWDPRADRVSLLTLHAAKGLEFPVIFVAGCEEGVLPLKWEENMTDHQLSEERRLFFVGMTRAKRRLFLSHAAKRFWRGKRREQVPSLFLKDIEEKLYQRQKSEYTKKPTVQTAQLDLF